MGGSSVTPGLVLASASPQRRAILDQLGIRFRAVAPEVEELVDGDPEHLVVENARRKARAVEGALVLGADTVVMVDGQAIGKPRDQREAAATLRRLSGGWHVVLGGIALVGGGRERTACAATRVCFRTLGEADISWYLAAGEWRERAGAYAIQGRGAALVERVEGDFFNVVGLPVAELLALEPTLIWA